MRENKKTYIAFFKTSIFLSSLLTTLGTQQSFADNFCLPEKKCIDLTLRDLEGISKKTANSYEFFYLSKNETRFFINIPRKNGCDIDMNFIDSESSRFKKNTIQVSTTPECLDQYKAAKKELDEKNEWNKADIQEVKLSIDPNLSLDNFILASRNAQNVSNIPEREWNTPESFKRDKDFASLNDHFIYSDEFIETDKNLNNLIAELNGYARKTEACIALKTAKSLQSAENALTALKTDLDAILAEFQLHIQDIPELGELETKISELEMMLADAKASFKDIDFDEQFAAIEESIKKEKSPMKALAAVDKLEKLSKAYPHRRDDVTGLQKKLVSKAIKISESEDYLSVIEKLDDFHSIMGFEEDYIDKKIDETYIKAAADNSLDPYDAESLMDAAKEKLYAYSDDKNEKQADRYFEISLSLADTYYLQDAENLKSGNKVDGYVRTLAEINKETKGVRSELIVSKISDVYAVDISAKNLEKMGKTLKGLEKRQQLKNEEVFNIYRGTAAVRVANLSTTGNLNIKAYNELHGLLTSIPKNMKLNLDQRMIFTQDFADISNAHLNHMANAGDKNFNYYYNRYQAQMKSDWMILAQEGQKMTYRSPKKQGKSEEEISDKMNAIQTQMATLDTAYKNNEQTGIAYQQIMFQRQLEAQELANKANQARLEKMAQNTQPQSQPGQQDAGRNPSVIEGPGMFPSEPVSPESRKIENSNSIMNGITVPEVQFPRST